MLEDVLRRCLVHCVYAAVALPHDAGHLLTPRLAKALLGADRSMPTDVKTAALGLIFAVRCAPDNSTAAEGSTSPQHSTAPQHKHKHCICTFTVPAQRSQRAARTFHDMAWLGLS